MAATMESMDGLLAVVEAAVIVFCGDEVTVDCGRQSENEKVSGDCEIR